MKTPEKSVEEFELPDDYEVVTAYNYPSIQYKMVIVANVKDEVAFCTFDYDSKIPVMIDRVKKVNLKSV